MKIVFTSFLFLSSVLGCAHRDFGSQSEVTTFSQLQGRVSVDLDMGVEDKRIQDREVIMDLTNFKQMVVMSWRISVDTDSTNVKISKIKAVARSLRTGSKEIISKVSSRIGDIPHPYERVKENYPISCFTSTDDDIEVTVSAWLVRENQDGTLTRTPEDSPLTATSIRSVPVIEKDRRFRGSLGSRCTILQ